MKFELRIEEGWKITVLLLFSIINLLYMHYYFLFRDLFEAELFVFSTLFNFLSVCFDVSLLFVFFFLLACKRVKISLLLTFLVTLLWSLSNVVYGEFFDQYISISSLVHSANLFEGLVIRSVLAKIDWVVLFFLFSFIAFVFVYRAVGQIVMNKKTILVFLLIPLISLLIILSIYSLYHFANPKSRNNTELYIARVKDYAFVLGSEKNAGPNKLRFQVGCVRFLLSDLYEYFNPKVLTEKEKEEIKLVVNDNKGKESENTLNPKLKNVVFIVLESFLSVSSDIKIGGLQVTPFLDSLKHTPGVYYNGHVKSNITLGESGDGQFIYMTGLLPCRFKITMGEVVNNLIPSLPSILKEHFGVKYTEVVIPTLPKIWIQDKMNVVYGIDNMYCSTDYDQGEKDLLTDEQVFNMASNTRKIANMPFYSMVLSISTHQPYTDLLDESFVINDSSFSYPFRVYLNACHYADCQIKKYIEHLKTAKQYDNTLICIVADHQPHMDSLQMGDDISQELPFYIINGGFDLETAYCGPCNQLDVFTTILDVLNINSKWKGLGCSLLSPNYKNKVNSELYRLSELIIESNYFSR